MPTPGDLSLCLERLLAAGLSNADYTRLHHFSLQGRRVYLTGGINYFGTYSALQGSNIALADRCMYVASQLEGGRTDKDSIIEEALNRWPLIPGQPAFVDQFSALGPAASRETVVTVRDRAPAVRERVLQRAAGHCEWCGKPGFKTVSGAVYLETHHVIPLAEGGPDHETNMLALCPDDHRRAHHAHDRADLSVQLRGKLDELCGADSSTGSRT